MAAATAEVLASGLAAPTAEPSAVRRSGPLALLAANCAISGVSVGAANVITNPLDTIKVRIQNTLASSFGVQELAPKKLSMVHTGLTMVRQEGITSLYSGTSATLARGLFYGGLRLGMYTPLKSVVGADAHPTSLARKLAAGSLSGALATLITNPIELLKTRLQSGAPGGPLGVVRSIVASDGVLGLWRGTLPSMARGTLLTATQCATYDDVKRLWLAHTGWQDGLATHVGVSMVTGLVACTVTAPADVIKTQMYLNPARFQGPLHCARKILAKEGVAGLFKGWTANYTRLGPQTTLMFVLMEKLRSAAGMSQL